MILCLLLIHYATGSNDFLSFPNDTERSTEICCTDENLLTCTEVKLNPSNLSKKKIILKGIEMIFQNLIHVL